MNVADAMTPRSEVVTVEIPGTRADVLEYLQERKFSSVPIIKQTDDGEQFRGLVSRESLIEQPDEDQLALLIEETPTVTADASIEHVAAVMAAEGARRVPVVDGSSKGSSPSRTSSAPSRPATPTARPRSARAARRYVNCVYAGTPLPVAEQELFHADVPYGVVLDDDGETCGMITEVDIIDVARVVEGEAQTGDSMASDDDDWKWESIKAVGSRYMPTRNVGDPGQAGPRVHDGGSGHRRGTPDRPGSRPDDDRERRRADPAGLGRPLVGIVRDMDLLEGL